MGTVGAEERDHTAADAVAELDHSRLRVCVHSQKRRAIGQHIVVRIKGWPVLGLNCGTTSRTSMPGHLRSSHVPFFFLTRWVRFQVCVVFLVPVHSACSQ